MTVIQKTIGRLPVNLGDYDSTKSYGKKNRVLLYGCEWESKVENNTYSPASLNTTTGVITPDTTHWKLISGSYNTWLIDNGYKKVDAANVKDGNNTQHEINNSVINAIGTDSTPSSIKGRVKSLEAAVGTGGSVDSRISKAVNAAKSEIKGNATSACDTLGEAEAKINANTTAISNEATARTNAVNAEATRAQAAEQLLQEQYNALTQSDIIVGALPASGTKNKIYRVPGTNSYSDYMWNGSSWVLMATYDNVTDRIPTHGSDNYVKSSGVYAADADLYRLYFDGMYEKEDLTQNLTVGTINSSGVFKNNTTSTKKARCIFFDLTGVDSVFIDAKVECVFTFLKSIPSADEAVDHATGYVNAYEDFEDNQNAVIQVPSDANYLYVLVIKTDESDLREGMAVYLLTNDKKKDVEIDVNTTTPDEDAILTVKGSEYEIISPRFVDTMMYFRGKDKTYSYGNRIYGVQGGKTYRFRIENPDIPIDNIGTGSGARFIIGCDGKDMEDTYLIRININDNVSIRDSYTFTLPQGAEFVYVDGRCDEGNVFRVYVAEVNINSLDLSVTTSSLDYIFAFGVQTFANSKGDLVELYSASETQYGEAGRTEDNHIVAERRNLCSLQKMTSKVDVAYLGEPYDGGSLGVVYNSCFAESNDADIIYCSFGAILPNSTIPALLTKTLNTLTMAVGDAAVNKLNWTGHSNVVFTYQAYLDMLYDLGLTSTHKTTSDDTIDNNVPFLYSGYYYKCLGDADNGIVILRSSDMVNWSYFNIASITVSNPSANEISIAIVDSKAYISYRSSNSSVKMGYVIYDIANTQTLADGIFPEGIEVRPCNFIFKGEVYASINVNPIYYGQTSGGGVSVHDRQEIMIYKFVNYSPKTVVRLANANGINYQYIFEQTVWGVTVGSSDYIRHENRNRLYMTFSEDRRKIHPLSNYRQYSNLATIDITDFLLG